MIILREIAALKAHLYKLKQENKTVGFVPTMGALHQGHLSLIRKSRAEADVTVCSIFINPTQFNDPKDFEKYPITTAIDTQFLIRENTDVLFMPSVEEMYPSGLNTSQHYDLGYLETILEGAHRPGHFQGVCQVVHRLLNIVEPDVMFLGQKDFQQCMVLKKLVELLSLPTKIEIVETVREQSGLAMSSRNTRLSDEQKEKATVIYHSLMEMKDKRSTKTIKELKEKAIANLKLAGFEKVDYVEIAEAHTLKLISSDELLDHSTPAVALIAAFIGSVRLIDSMTLTQ